MVEVFKTNIEDRARAVELLHQLNEQFPDYLSNFDLQDCDRILRIESGGGIVNTARVIEIFTKLGYTAECL